MAVVPMNAEPQFSHFHPNHPLGHYFDDQSYVCHACKTTGFGARLRCHACVVDMHMYCANCPHELSSSFHNHRLTLLKNNQAQAASFKRQCCDFCRESIDGDGLFYRCHDCDFDLHPVCSQLPQELSHVADERHKLRLKKLSYGNCVVCNTDCSSLWVYGCGICNVNIHLNCLRKPYGSQRTQSREIRYAQPWWWTGQPPHLGRQYPYGCNGSVNQDPLGHWGFLNHPVAYPPGHGHNYEPAPSAYNDNSSRPPSHAGSYSSNHAGSYSSNHAGSYSSNHAGSYSSSLWSMFGSTMFSLIENISIGALTEFIFGSMGF